MLLDQRAASCTYVVSTQLPYDAHLIYSTLYQDCSLPTPTNSISKANGQGSPSPPSSPPHHPNMAWIAAPAIGVIVIIVIWAWLSHIQRPRLQRRQHPPRRRRQANAASASFPHRETGHAAQAPPPQRQASAPRPRRPRRGSYVRRNPEDDYEPDDDDNVPLHGPAPRYPDPPNEGRPPWAQSPPRPPPARQPPPIPAPPSPVHLPSSQPARRTVPQAGAQPLGDDPLVVDSETARRGWNQVRRERRREVHSRPRFPSTAAEPDVHVPGAWSGDDTLVGSRGSRAARREEGKDGEPPLQQMEIDDRGERVRRNADGWVAYTLGLFR